MVWPFNRKSTQLALLDNVKVLVERGDLQAAYRLLSDSESPGLFLMKDVIREYIVLFRELKELLAKDNADRTAILAALDRARRKFNAFIICFEELN